MALRRCTEWRGSAHILDGDLAAEAHEDVLLVPLGNHGPAGLYDRERRLIEAAAYFRGVPSFHLPIEAETTPLDPAAFPVAESGWDYLYVGHLTGHYGHFLFAALARLWCLRCLRGPNTKLVILNEPRHEGVFRLDFVAKIFGSFGLRREDFLFFNQPTRIGRIVVPQPSIQECISGHRAYAEMCHRLGRSLTSGLPLTPSVRPAFMSKSLLASGIHGVVNEDVLCDHLERHGVDIVFPEALPFDRQVLLFLERDLIAGMAGSAMHTSIFAPERRLLMINHESRIVSNHIIIDRLARNADLQVYPDGDILREDRDNSFQNRWRFVDPARTAHELLRLFDEFHHHDSVLNRTLSSMQTPHPAASGDEADPESIRVGAHIQGLGDLWCSGDWVGHRESRQWIEGVMVVPGPGIITEEVEYSEIDETGAAPRWVRGGELCGSRGQSVPLRGLRVRLRGFAAAAYELSCAATFTDGSVAGPLVGTDLSCQTDSRAPLEAIQLQMRRRGPGPASQSVAGPGEYQPNELHAKQPGNSEGDEDEFAIPDLGGEHYLAFLKRLHKALRPKNYLEIGTSSGDSLSLSESPSIAVDPRFAIDKNVIGIKPSCLFYQMSSDNFFASVRVKELLGGPIAMAFLDGMHLFEVVLRDFINVEENSRQNSVVCLHDCVPLDIYMARREVGDPIKNRSRSPASWTGDVWKAVVILQRYRPDLKIHTFDAAPTGMVLITNLDPHSTRLRDSYFSLISELRDQELSEYGIRRYVDSLQMRSTDCLRRVTDIMKYVWL